MYEILRLFLTHCSLLQTELCTSLHAMDMRAHDAHVTLLAAHPTSHAHHMTSLPVHSWAPKNRMNDQITALPNQSLQRYCTTDMRSASHEHHMTGIPTRCPTDIPKLEENSMTFMCSSSASSVDRQSFSKTYFKDKENFMTTTPREIVVQCPSTCSSPSVDISHTLDRTRDKQRGTNSTSNIAAPAGKPLQTPDRVGLLSSISTISSDSSTIEGAPSPSNLTSISPLSESQAQQELSIASLNHSQSSQVNKQQTSFGVSDYLLIGFNNKDKFCGSLSPEVLASSKLPPFCTVGDSSLGGHKGPLLLNSCTQTSVVMESKAMHILKEMKPLMDEEHFGQGIHGTYLESDNKGSVHAALVEGAGVPVGDGDSRITTSDDTLQPCERSSHCKLWSHDLLPPLIGTVSSDSSTIEGAPSPSDLTSIGPLSEGQAQQELNIKSLNHSQSSRVNKQQTASGVSDYLLVGSNHKDKFCESLSPEVIAASKLPPPCTVGESSLGSQSGYLLSDSCSQTSVVMESEAMHTLEEMKPLVDEGQSGQEICGTCRENERKGSIHFELEEDICASVGGDDGGGSRITPRDDPLPPYEMSCHCIHSSHDLFSSAYTRSSCTRAMSDDGQLPFMLAAFNHTDDPVYIEADILLVTSLLNADMFTHDTFSERSSRLNNSSGRVHRQHYEHEDKRDDIDGDGVETTQ